MSEKSLKLALAAADGEKSPQIRPFVLASGSPRRRLLLTQFGYSFRVVVSDVEEPDGARFDNPEAYAAHTAWLKAAAVARRPEHAADWVLAADTIAAVGPTILGKPVDRADAERILRQLIGTTHNVWTAICLYLVKLDLALSATVCTTVHMRPIEDAQLNEYLDSHGWLGRAGAYGIQDDADPFVSAIEGSFTNVVGLPMERLADLFQRAQQMDPK